MEIRINVDDDFVKSLSEKLGVSKTSALTTEALTLLNWAANEAKAGRVILSANQEGKELKQLSMPALEKIKVTK